MNIVRQEKSGTIELRLEANEYLIVHTPNGTIDINVPKSHLDLGEKAAENFDITRWSPWDRKPQHIDKLVKTR